MKEKLKSSSSLSARPYRDEIAIIGMSCRFPGAENYHDFWNNLVNENFSVTEIPESRWNWRDYYGDPNQDNNKTNSKWGGFISDIDKFDPLFFNISPKEAKYIDPQHRIFLEAAWHAVEDAGYSTGSLSGKKIGVYVGVSKNDYAEMLQSTHQEISSFVSTGTVHSILANRVSYLLDICGKSEVVDTACSSSLVALHNAIRDIRLGGCEGALVGGVNALITPTMYLSHGKSGMLSSEGKCKTFDERSDGYVRAEGVGCIFIKPLSKALVDNDTILGIIKGTAVNHNGRSNSLTSPSARSQSEVIEAALDDAGLEAGQVSYIEAHGTATPLGDPIEVSALKKVFGGYSKDDDIHCGLGAVKTNIGHLESAAGMAGLFKVLLCMRHKKLPALLHYQKLNPYIDLTGSPLYVNDHLTDWKKSAKGLQSGPLTAGISSFGMGGVNAHVILQAFEDSCPQPLTSAQSYFLIPLSAKTLKQLKIYANNIAAFLKGPGEILPLQDIAFTMQTGRDAMNCRVAFKVSTVTELISQLQEYVTNDKHIVAEDSQIQQWLAGADIDWNSLAGRRIALPGYPFERRACWMDAPADQKNTVETPLLEFKNNNQKHQWQYQSLLRKTDYFVRDHVVQGECMLPGVAYLEIARAVAEQACGRSVNELNDICWIHAVLVKEMSMPLHINLQPVDKGFSFEITTTEGVHANGNILLETNNTVPKSIDLQNIRERCKLYKTADEIYAALSKEGLGYLNTFKTIKEGFFADAEALCYLEPTIKDYKLSEKVWDPSLLDGVFQTVVGLCIWGAVEHSHQLLPFYLKSIRCYGNPATARYAYVRKSATYEDGSHYSFDMLLCDDNGNVIIAFDEFIKRAYKAATTSIITETTIAPAVVESLHYTTAWLERPLGILNERPKSLIIFDKDENLYEEVKKQYSHTIPVLILPGDTYHKKDKNTYYVNPADAASFKLLVNDLIEDDILIDNWVYRWGMERGEEIKENIQDVYTLLYLSQALISCSYNGRVKLLYLYDYRDTYSSAVQQMTGGFARTLAYENPLISIQTVGISEDAKSSYQKIIFQEIARYFMAPLREVIYRQERREERVVVAANVPPASTQNMLKENGCYLITGGAGGLGMVFAAYLAMEYKANIVLVGRSLKNAAIEEKLQDLRQLGGNAAYYSADVSDKKAITKVIDKVRKLHKTINGIIHAAGLIEDAFILNKQASSFERVIAPKVYGAIHLDECTKDDSLDFFMVFSSIASLMPNQGQCDYAAANNFLDHLMQIRSNRQLEKGIQGISLAINWPLWENGGIDVTDAEREHLWEVFGMKPMSHQRALDGFVQLLNVSDKSTPCQAILIEGIAHKISAHLNVEQMPAVTAAHEKASAGDLLTTLQHVARAVLPVLTTIKNTDSFNTLGFDSVSLVKLAGKIQEQLGVAINPITLIEHNTIARLAVYLENEVTISAAISPGQTSYLPETSLIDAERSDKAQLLFKKRFSNDEFFMQDHVVEGKYNVPGACYIEMGRQAVTLLDKKVYSMSNNYWPEVLSSAGAPIDARIQLINKENGYDYEVYSRDASGNKTVHALGEVNTNVILKSGDLGVLNLNSLKQKLNTPVSRDNVYAQIIAEGLHVGPSFMPMEELWISKQEALGHLMLPAHVADTLSDYMLHPSMLTGVFQTALINNKPNGITASKYIPVAIEEIVLTGQIPAECYVHTTAHENNERMSGIKKFDALVADKNGLVVARLKGFAIKEITNNKEVAGEVSPAIKPVIAAVGITGPSIENVELLLKTLLHEGIGLEISELDADVPFEALGINSRMIIDLNRLLAKTFGNLSKTLFFEYRNINELAGYFQKKHSAVLQELIAEEQPVAAIKEPEQEVVTVVDKITETKKEEYTKDIAIVGIGGKYPQADSLSEFWDLLKNGKDCIVEIPENRFDYSSHFDENKEKGLLYSRWGGFINNVDQFDPLFFNISPREAEEIDPQERLFLEVVWNTLEDAGITREKLISQSKKIGVFVGALWQPYVNLGVEEMIKGNPIAPSGLLYNIPNRVSYFFNWTGPSIAIDTACSASLTALHYACESIRSGESESCIAGGVNLSLSLSKYLFLSQHNFLSTDGRCRSFGIGDGYVPGEGIGAVLLKSLEDAIANGDQIYGIIKGTAVNHGGRTNGYTVPNPNLQGELIQSALKKAQIDARTISYVEAHGTGTSLGDPIEITGLCKAFEDYTDDKQFCAIGSVKSNIGHLEASAGIAGLTKILLQFKHTFLVPSIHSATINPNISFEETPFHVQQNLAEWRRPLLNINGQQTEIPLRAMLSSFGAGGSNAHVIVEEYKQPVINKSIDNRPAIIVLSATDQERLHEQALNLQNFIQKTKGLALHDIAYTLQIGREAMEERFAIIANDIPSLIEQLAHYLNGTSSASVTSNIKLNTREQLLLNKGAAGQSQMQQAILAGDWGTVANLWVNAFYIDWELIYPGNKPSKISMPTYAFAKERYWLPIAGAKNTSGINNNLHPLLHTNTSDLDEQQYTSIFTGQEIFLRDHQVQNKKILPGVAYLELARIAGVLGAHQKVTQLKQVSWISPIWVNSSAETIYTNLYRKGAQIGYEINSLQQEEEVVHNSGTIILTEIDPPQAMNVAQLKAAAKREVSGKEIYKTFDAAGLNLGNTFQGVEKLYIGQSYALSKISLLNTEGFVYPPNVLDSLLHAIYGLMESDGGSYALVLPYYAGEINFYKEIAGAKELWGYAVQKTSGQDHAGITADFYLLNENGHVLVYFKDFIFLPLDGISKNRVQQEINDAATYFFQGQWLETVLSSADQIESTQQLILLAGGSAGLCDKLQEQLGLEVLPITQLQPEAYFNSILKIVKEKIGQKLPIHITVVCQHTDYLDYGFISGLLKTAHLEHPEITGSLLLVDSLSVKDLEELTSLIEAEQNTTDAEVRFYNGRREVKTLMPFVPEFDPAQNVTIQEGGVYLLTGGAGALGQMIASHVCSKKNIKLVLIGRSPLTGDISSVLQRIPGAVYHPCDVSNKEEMQALIKMIKAKYGKLNGVIHAAGVIRDSFIANKTSAQVSDVFSAKILGTQILDEVTKDEPLDFMVYFSSISGIKGNIGQADYAAANAYLNNYAEYRNAERLNKKRQGKTLSINWPLWKDGGMQVSEESAKYLEKQWDMLLLPSAAGMTAFDTLLNNAEGQVMVAYKQDRVSEKIKDVLAVPSIEVPIGDTARLQEQTEHTIVEIIAKLLKINTAAIKKTKEFGGYGFESISLTKFAHTLNEYYELDLLPTVFYNYATVDSLTSFLVKEHSAQLAIKHGNYTSAAVKQTISHEAPVMAHHRPSLTRLGRSAGHPVVNAQPDQMPVAIIGISGRFPGSPDLDTFWDNLRQNKDLITEIQPDRWDWKAYYGDSQKEKNKTKAKWGGFISDIDKFDPQFFSISPREAELMDPQQRITLEAVYQALEDAAIAPNKIKGSNTGIFIGVSTSDYSLLLNKQSDFTSQGHYATGSVHSVLVNRISYLLDIHGPSEPVDTACSSSLIAIHRAVEHIRNGHCNMAIAGGVNALLSPELTLSFSEAGMLSEDGRCKTFDQSANGYVRGEGVGIIVLKALQQAEADGDHIYGIIRGTAENHGGKANTLTSPNPKAQRDLLLKAYRSADIDPRDVSYIEAHGTGTPLGDPIEIEGLKLAFDELYKEKDIQQPDVAHCSIGSVKTNIGHLEAAAGIAGVMKVLLSIRHQTLPGNPHLGTPNEYLKLEGSPFRLQQNTGEWTVSGAKPRIAGISSFGFGGANAHIIIEEYIPVFRNSYNNQQPAIVVLSARTEDRLKAQVQQLLDYVKANPGDGLHDIAYTLQMGREAMEERLALVVADEAELLMQLDNYLTGNSWHLLRGNDQANSDFLLEGEAGKAYIETAVKNKEVHALAQLWIKGIQFDWTLLYPDNKPARISLPAYPFARNRYWLPVEAKTPVSYMHNSRLHPLVHSNESDLYKQQYAAIYTGNESFLADHMVRGEKILPGVAYLELARVAGELSSRHVVTKLKNVSWIAPLKITGETAGVNIVLKPGQTGIKYEINNQQNESIIHGSGHIITGEPSLGEFMDIEGLKAACTNELHGSEIYQMFNQEGLNLGNSFRGVERLYRDENSALSFINLSGIDGCVYSPGILDSLLHTICGLETLDGQSYSLALPYFVKEVNFYKALADTSIFWGYARKSEGYGADDQVVSYDLDLLNENGEILVSFKDFVALPPDGFTSSKEAENETQYLPGLNNESAGVDNDLLTEKVADKIKEFVADLIKLETADVRKDRKFGDFGFDSILLTRFTNLLNEHYSLDLMPTVFYNYATINKLSSFLIADHYDQLVNQHLQIPIANLQPETAAKTVLEPAGKLRFIADQPNRFNAEPVNDHATEPVAIIGMSGRFPGSPDLAAFWENLSTNKDLITEIPADRWDWKQYYGDPQTDKNKTRAKWGGFITDIDKFDPLFFNISPLEAELMDPQQRILLEAVYQALEDANIAADKISGSNTGVFIGVSGSDYATLLRNQTDLSGHMHYTTGSVHSILVNRISYLLDINGPSEPVDTACSSSLIAIHRAVENIRNGTCHMAIAGGVNALISPELTLAFSQSGMLSEDGRCKTFDERANGYVRGEGVGIIILKSLQQAEADGDSILGVIRGTAENHGGRANTLTSPNPVAQKDLLLHAYRSAGIDPRQVSYIEAHGTGTPLGDPIEIEGLKLAFAELYKENNLQQSQQSHCSIGSVKANIGHLESAAGIAGVIKVLLCLRHRTLPGNPHLLTPNPYLKLDGTPFHLQKDTAAWTTEADELRVAGISSFGFGGANAHIIIEEYISQPVNPYKGVDSAIILLSAKNKEQLKKQVTNLHEYLQKNSTANLNSIAYTLQTGRAAMEERLAFLADDKEQLMVKLSAYLAGEEENLHTGNIKQNKAESLLEGNALEAYIHQTIAKKETSSLIRLWLEGVSIDWTLLYKDSRPAKINLPTYPFIKDRYWVPADATKTITTSIAQLHPLLHHNESDLNEQKYTSIYTGHEIFLQDHQVKGEKVLPGVAYLELARIAGNLSTRKPITQIRNISWLNPIKINNQPQEIKVNVYTEGEHLNYEVYSIINNESVIHGSGSISTIVLPEPNSVAIEQLKSMAVQELNGSEMYQEFRFSGLELGTSYRGVQTMYAGTEGCLSKIKLESQEGFIYSPGILDSMLHTIYGLQFVNNEPYTLALPYFMGEVNCYKSLAGSLSLWAYARRSQEYKAADKVSGYDIDLLNDNGEVLISFRNFVALPLAKEPQKTESIDYIYQPAWEQANVDDNNKNSGTTQQQLIFLADGSDILARELQEQLGIEIKALSTNDPINYFETICNKIKELQQQKNPFRITVIYENKSHAQAGFINGLLKTATQENDRITGRTIGVESFSIQHLDDLSAIIKREQYNGDVEIRYNGGVRETNQLKPVNIIAGLSPDTGIHEDGVYLITGGAGGLGRIFAEHISKTKNVKIILTGRSLPGEEIKRLLAALPGTTYYQCDISNEKEVSALFKTIKQTHAQLNGIIHSAGTLRDSFIINKTSDQINQVLAPKILGAQYLDEITKHEPLDFMVFFSSIAGISGNIGQADYASANVYLDHFAQFRNEAVAKGQRQGKTFSINWPLWKEGGMQVDIAIEQYLEKKWGILPMPTTTGVDIFNIILQNKPGQYACYYGKKAAITEKTGGDAATNKPQSITSTAINDLQEKVSASIINTIAQLLKLDVSIINSQQEFGDYGFDSLLLTRFAKALNNLYNLELMPTVFYNHPTVESLTAFLLDEYQDRFINKRDDHRQEPAISVSDNHLSHTHRFNKPKTFGSVMTNHQAPDAIAIVGISGRFPGSPDLTSFWDNLKNNEDLITEIPADRWNWKQYYGDPQNGAFKTKAKWGGFITDIDKFDPLFFNISPKEAALMDPQQRITLEAVIHALEDAGIAPSKIKGSNTGAFIGVSGVDYSVLLNNGTDAISQAQFSTGIAHSMLVNRISYLLDIHGPSEPVDTACSSSLIAIHRAVEHIRNGHCDMAIAGGVNAILSPELTLSFSRAGMLSDDGRCKTFDQSANGYVRGEGVGVIILKSLAMAEADGDHIYGVIRGTAENHGGKANTLTSPNPKAQKDLLLKAYRTSNTDPRDVSYIEAHGTGTALGDPIEIEGLKMAFRELYKDKQLPIPKAAYCSIGSVKANIGHLESAAGMAGVAKVLMAIQHKTLPGNPHLKTANTFLQLENSPFLLQKETTAWETENNKPRIAGISSFGFGGANAHIIIEEYQAPVQPLYNNTSPAVIPLSAKNSQQLQLQVNNLKQYLDVNPKTSIHAMARTLQEGRDAMKERVVFIAADVARLIKLLSGYSIGQADKLLADDNIFYDNKQRLAAISTAWLNEEQVDWSVLYIDKKPGKISLPVYPFIRNRYWVPEHAQKIEKIEAQEISLANIPAVSEDKTGNTYTPIWSRIKIEQSIISNNTGKHLIVSGQGVKKQAGKVLEFLSGKGIVVTTVETLTDIPPQGVTDIYLLQGLYNAANNHALNNGYDQRELPVFRTIKRLLDTAYAETKLNVTVLMANTQQVFSADKVQEAGSGIAGLIGSLAKEQPQWQFRVIDVELDVDGQIKTDMQKLLLTPFNNMDVITSYRNGYAYKRELFEIELPNDKKSKLKQNGTYVMLGGAGGIGKATTAYLVNNYQAQVIWLGRRSPDVTIFQAQDEIAQLGVRPIYIQCDANNEADLIKAYQEIKNANMVVNGLFHSAIVLNDKSLRNMSEEDFVKSFEIKSTASHYLIETFKQEPLDFICFYSSVQAQWSAPGQANYAAGCTYKDSYAHSIRHKYNIPVSIINWGYWGDVGVVSSADYKKRMKRLGIESISSERGMSILEQVLSNNESQVFAVKLT